MSLRSSQMIEPDDFEKTPASAPVRFSRLRLMGKSPAHYKHGYVAGTKPMLVGSAVHAALLGGPAVVVWDGVRRGKDYDAFVSDQLAGTLILSEGEARERAYMVARMGANREAMRHRDDI